MEPEAHDDDRAAAFREAARFAEAERREIAEAVDRLRQRIAALEERDASLASLLTALTELVASGPDDPAYVPRRRSSSDTPLPTRRSLRAAAGRPVSAARDDVPGPWAVEALTAPLALAQREGLSRRRP